MEFGIAFGAFALIGIGIVIGINTRGRLARLTPVDTNTSDCDPLCNQIGTKALERRAAEVVYINALVRMGLLILAVLVAAATAVALWVAVVQATVSIVGLPAVPALTIAAIGATAATLVLTGILADSILDVAGKASEAENARDAEAQSRDLFLSKCKDPNKVSSCLSRPLPN